MKTQPAAPTVRSTPTDPPQLWICLDEAEAAEIVAGRVPARVAEETDKMLRWSLSDPTPDRADKRYTVEAHA
jgi:hypothetical protein